MSDIDKAVLDFDPLLDSQETDVEYIIRGTLEDRDQYSYKAISKSKDRVALEGVYGVANIITQDPFVITGNADAEFTLDIPLLTIFRHDFGGGDTPILYNLPAFVSQALFSGTIATGGTVNYLYITFNATVIGTDNFRLRTSTSMPVAATQLVLASYTVTGAPGSYVITVTDIYPDGSLDKDFEEGNDGTETSPDSFFGRLGKKLRDGFYSIASTIVTLTSTTVNATTVNTTTVTANTVSEKTVGAGSSVQAKSGEQLLTKIIDIGDWNMNTTINASVAHGVTSSNIRSVDVIIRRDSSTSTYKLELRNGNGDAGDDDGGGISEINTTDIILTRTTGALFNISASFSATSFNRGWVTITYIA